MGMKEKLTNLKHNLVDKWEEFWQGTSVLLLLHKYYMSHVLIVAVAMLALYLYSLVVPTELVVAMGAALIFYGREVRDAQLYAGKDFGDGLRAGKGFVWAAEEWWFRNWTRDCHMDFWPPFAFTHISAAFLLAAKSL